MHYYYSNHKCSLCFVEEYLIPPVLVSWPCASFFFKGYCWDTCKSVPGNAGVLHGYYTLNELPVLPC